MLKRSLSVLLALSLGLFLVACEVQNDTDATEGDTVTGDGVALDTTPLPCSDDGICEDQCALDGNFDPDCFYGVAECKDADATALLENWFAGTMKDKMSPNARNCDWTVGKCDAQFRCDDGVASPRPCFCDPDCYTSADGVPTGLVDPCTADDHCDTWCPTGLDPDCSGNADDGKYCQ